VVASRTALRAIGAAAVAALAAGSLSGVLRADPRPAPIVTAMPTPYFAAGQAPARRWLRESRPLGPSAPPWARRLYGHSLLVLRALTDPASGAEVAGARPGWEYVWPRDAAAGAMALAASGHTVEAQRVAGFLLRLDLSGAARFEPNGDPVPGRPPPGDAEGWVAAAAHASGLGAPSSESGWRDRQDYGENVEGDLLGNAIAAGAPAVEILDRFMTPRGLAREDGGADLDSAAAWAVVPFERPGLREAARRTLLSLAGEASGFGTAPIEGWTAGEAWTAPTAWSAWALARLGERSAADRLLAALRRAATGAGTLPERVSSAGGRPLSTTPLAWSHAFTILALLERYPPAA
jgi:glucoamylase